MISSTEPTDVATVPVEPSTAEAPHESKNVPPESKEASSESKEASPESNEAPKDGFAQFGLSAEIERAIAEKGYSTATPIQAMSIAPILDGKDVMGQAETGTGKTAAFALPLLARLDLKQRRPQILVLAPTRELAIQVAKAFEEYGKFLPKLNVATIYGGQAYSIQERQLRRGAHVVVGTPGRIMDHLRRQQLLSLDGLKTLVLDEADEMLRMGFAEDVEWIVEQMPEKRQTLLFSATLSDRVHTVASKYLSDPVRLHAKSQSMTAANVRQRVCCTKFSEKTSTLARILESEENDGVIVFVKTRQTSSQLAEALCQKGYKASALNGDMAQNRREQTIRRLKSGQLDILVATDVAARGLDVPRISHVVNYDYPHDAEAYVHRIGRTGRAGRDGNAILFVTPREKKKLRFLEKKTGQSITWMDRPTEKSIRKARGVRLAEKVVQDGKHELSRERKWVSDLLKENENLTIEDVAAALAAQAIRQTDVQPSETSFSDDVKESRKDRKSKRSSADAGSKDWSASSHSDGEPGPGAFRDKRNKKHGKKFTSRAKYRVEVGYNHGVRPRNLVGAITSEAELTGSDIGSIDIEPQYTTIELPSDLSDSQIECLKNLRVAGQPLQLSKATASATASGSRRSYGSKPAKKFGKKSGKPKPRHGKVKFVKKKSKKRKSPK